MLATRPATDTIAIARTFDGVEGAAHRVIEQIGGMTSVLKGAEASPPKQGPAWKTLFNLPVVKVAPGLPASKVTAMFVFSHPWAALLMTTTGMACLSALGLTISSAMKVQNGREFA